MNIFMKISSDFPWYKGGESCKVEREKDVCVVEYEFEKLLTRSLSSSTSLPIQLLTTHCTYLASTV